MKNIFLFIQRYFVFICFILLQIACIILLSNNSKTHEAFFAATANELTGPINKKYAGVKDYLALKQINQQLAEENARLKNQFPQNFEVADTSIVQVADSTQKDTLNRIRKFTYLPAKVVGNTVTLPNNYVMIERGALQGVEKDMSVVGPQGIVGIVTEVSNNYAKVMSLLHRYTKVSAMLKKNNSVGDVEWDGEDPHYVTMRRVSKTSEVKKGDTVVTSNYSGSFPAGILVGTVVEVKPEPAASFYIVKLKTATNFFTLQQVYVIKNAYFSEQNALQKKKDPNKDN